MSIDSDFRRGSKNASSIMEGEVTPLEVQRFMETSFYLPVDILKDRDWHVFPIRVITGEEFKTFADVVTLRAGDFLHCVEDKELLFKAQFVALSTRRRAFTRQVRHVAKIWYGAAPK